MVGRIELGDASIAQRLNDLEAYNTPFQSTPPATRVVYVFRFSTATEIFHLSLETTNDGQTRCYGGRLDSNDQILNPASLSTIGAAYNTDSDVHPMCNVQGSSLVLKAPVADLPGLILARNLYSVTAFTMAGPAEALQALIDPMRTVDASPAFDASRPSDLEGSRTDLLSVR